MTLSLTSAQQRTFAAAARALLSPLDLESIDEWRADVLEHMAELFEADSAGFLLPGAGDSPYTLRNLPDAFGREFLETPVFLDVVVANARENDSRVWSTRMLGALIGMKLPDDWLQSDEYLRFYGRYRIQEALGFAAVADVHSSVPARSRAGAPTPIPALVSCFREEYGSAAFGDRGLAILRMLLPALEAGVTTAVRLAGAAATIQDVLDASSAGAMIVDVDGLHLYDNAALAKLLARDPEGARIRAAMERAAAALTTVLRTRTRGRGAHLPPLADANGELRTDRATYRLWATLIREEVLGARPAVLVQVERRTPGLPSASKLAERWKLTRQQARVARLLARGKTNRQIAAALRIRESTARHYTEAVFRKLGVHTRAEAAGKILGA